MSLSVSCEKIWSKFVLCNIYGKADELEQPSSSMLQSTLTGLRRFIRPAAGTLVARAGSGMAAPVAVEVSPVEHNRQNKEFSIQLTHDGVKQQEKAVLQYDWISNKSVDLYHTGVPTAFRGRGIAKVLAQAAMDFVVTEDLKMKLTCTYLQKYVQDNPDPQYTERVLDS